MNDHNPIRREVLADARKSAGLSQEEIARAAGMQRSYYSLIELGIRNPSIEAAVRIADALRTTVDSLFPNEPEDSILYRMKKYRGVGELKAAPEPETHIPSSEDIRYMTAAINRLASAIENTAGRHDEELLNSEAFQKAARKAADKAIDDTLGAMTKSMCSMTQIFASRTKNLFDQSNSK